MYVCMYVCMYLQYVWHVCMYMYAYMCAKVKKDDRHLLKDNCCGSMYACMYVCIVHKIHTYIHVCHIEWLILSGTLLTSCDELCTVPESVFFPYHRTIDITGRGVYSSGGTLHDSNSGITGSGSGSGNSISNSSKKKRTRSGGSLPLLEKKLWYVIIILFCGRLNTISSPLPQPIPPQSFCCMYKFHFENSKKKVLVFTHVCMNIKVCINVMYVSMYLCICVYIYVRKLFYCHCYIASSIVANLCQCYVCMYVLYAPIECMCFSGSGRGGIRFRERFAQ